MALQQGVEELQECTHQFGAVVAQEAFHLYSALRDPLDMEVRAYFDAEGWLVEGWSHCIFANAHSDWRQPDNHRVVAATKKLLPDPGRRLNGYMMTCPDPGANFTRLIFTQSGSGIHSCALQSITVSTIEVVEEKKVGACVGPLYSERPLFTEWIEYVAELGVSHVDVYYTGAQDKRDVSAFYGVDNNENDPLSVPFYPLENPLVTYRYYQPSRARWYFAQSTLYNDCIFRNRQAQKYMLVLDIDEFLVIRHPAGSLLASLDALFPADSAALLLDSVLYHARCAPNSDRLNDTKSTLPEIVTHFFKSRVAATAGKAIVMPQRVVAFWIHWVTEAEKDFTTGVVRSIEDLYVKHIKFRDDCEGEMVDERNAAAFTAAAELDRAHRGR